VTGFVLALLASVSWGVSDFLGGLKTRTVPLPVVLAVSQVAGMAVLLVALAAHHHAMPSDPRLWYSIAAGFSSLAALGLLYSAMTKGAIAIVAPVAASGAVLPVLVGFVRGDAISWLACAGIVLALAGALGAAWAPGTPQDKATALTSGLLALGAAVCIGGYFTLIETASRSDPYWATTIARLVACAAILAFLAARWSAPRLSLTRRFFAPPLVPQPVVPHEQSGDAGGRLSTPVLISLAAIGITDALSEILFATASTIGELGIVAVLSSIYPVITVALAFFLLRERLRWPQTLAATSAIAGVILLGYATG
jgi:drug/metabolite transporter (DMT)-like permease